MEEIIEIYTDASLMPNSQYFGIGIHIIDENECETSYGKFVDFNETKSKNKTIQISELFAIYQALKNIKIKKYKNKTIYIYTDNDMVFTTLNQKTKIRNKLKGESLLNSIKSKINFLISNKNIVEIRWIPAHKNIYGNNIVDKIAKKYNKTINKQLIEITAYYIYKKSPMNSELNNWILAEKMLLKQQKIERQNIFINTKLTLNCNIL